MADYLAASPSFTSINSEEIWMCQFGRVAYRNYRRFHEETFTESSSDRSCYRCHHESMCCDHGVSMFIVARVLSSSPYSTVWHLRYIHGPEIRPYHCLVSSPFSVRPTGIPIRNIVKTGRTLQLCFEISPPLWRLPAMCGGSALFEVLLSS